MTYIQESIIKQGDVYRVSRLQSRLKDMFGEDDFPSRFQHVTRFRNILHQRYPILLFTRPSKVNVGGIVYCNGKDTSLVDQWESSCDETCSESTCTDASPVKVAPAITKSVLDERALYHCARSLENTISEVKGLNEKWPPTSADLQVDEVASMIPSQLFNFMAWMTGCSDVFTDDGHVSTTEESRRRLLSICQDVIYLQSRGRSMMPKHVALGMTLRHMTGSSNIIGLVNGLGHCTSHTTVLEHDSALATLQLQQGKLVPDGFAKSLHTTLVWDNNDFTEETLTGQGTTHNTNGIIIQHDVAAEQAGSIPYRFPKSRSRTVSAPCTELIHHHGGKRQGPTPVDIDTCVVGRVDHTSHVGVRTDQAYCIAKLTATDLPGWTGFNTRLAKIPTVEKSKIGYLPIIDASPTQMDTVNTVLLRSISIADFLNLNAIAVVFDQAIYAKAQSLRWQTPAFSQRLVVRLGDFHLAMAFMACIGKRFHHSGLEDILVEAGVVAPGSIAGVVSGHHYNRAIRAHKYAYEALQQLRWKSFLKSLPEEGSIVESVFAAMAKIELSHTWLEGLSIPEAEVVFTKYDMFVQNERAKSPVFDFWSSYIDMVQTLLLSLRATREGNWLLHLSSCKEMAVWFHAYDRINYERYLPAYILEMEELSTTHPEIHEAFSHGKFAVQRQSNYGFSQVACDMTIEQTMNRDSKTKGGMVGITLNKGAVNRWVLSHPERAAIAKSCQVMAGKDDSVRSRKDLDVVHIRRDNEAVRSIVDTVEVMVNPFSYCGEKLVNISSGLVVGDDIAQDLLQAHQKGCNMYSAFCKERLFVGATKDLHDPIKMSKLKTFTSSSTRCVASKVRAEKQIQTTTMDLFTRLLIVSQNRDIDLKQVLTYSLTPLPVALCTPDGSNIKTSKSALLHALEKDVTGCCTVSVPPNSALLLDGMAIIQAMPDKGGTFQDFADDILATAIRSCMSMRCTRVDFVIDRYPDISIKNCERGRRESSGVQVVCITRPDQKKPRQMKKFLSSGKNKESLILFIRDAWSQDSAKIPQSIELYLCHERQCTRLRKTNGKVVGDIVPELESDHEEADTRLLLHAKHASSTHTSIIITSPDTDVFVLSLAACQDLSAHVFFLTGSGTNQRIFNVNMMASKYGSSVCKAIVGLHVFTGCDSVSAFKGKGKVKSLRLLTRSQAAIQVFSQLGDSWDIGNELFKGLEEFVCQLYSASTCSVNDARYKIFTAKCRFDSALPPNQDCLHQHSLRANYQVGIYRRCFNAIIAAPNPAEHGWDIKDDNITFRWMTVPAAPAGVLQNVNCCCVKSQCVSLRCSCKKAGLPCTELCKCVDCHNDIQWQEETDNEESSDDETEL